MKTIASAVVAAAATSTILFAGTAVAQNVEPTIIGGSDPFGAVGACCQQSNAIDGAASSTTPPFAGDRTTEYASNDARLDTFLLFDLGVGAPAIRSITFTDRNSSASAGRDDILTGTFTFSADNSFAPESGAPESGDVRVSFTDDAPGGGSPATTIIPTGLTTGFQFVRFDVGTAANPGDPG